ncbi:MAG: hypothetical protein ACI9Y1_003501 [Lentisphaeria bacterium]|jgi:hypothetical protein
MTMTSPIWHMSALFPHGIYDLQHNDAMINIGVSAETSEVACGSIKLCWKSVGLQRYSDATAILILADGGGSNSSSRHVFKEALQQLSNEIGIELRMTHYPPYTSKWNPIEYKLFPHVTRAMSGVVFKNHELVRELIENIYTEQGLKVTANIIDKVCETGKMACKEIYDTGTIVFDQVLGKLNYKVRPDTS